MRAGCLTDGFREALPFNQVAPNLNHFAKSNAAKERESKETEAIKLYRKGRSLREIAVATGLARSTIHRITKNEASRTRGNRRP